MKKLILATIVLIATSNIYVSCTPDSLTDQDQYDEKALDKDEIEEDDI